MDKKNILKKNVWVFLISLLASSGLAYNPDSLLLAFKRLPESKKNNMKDTTSCYILSLYLDVCADDQIQPMGLQLKKMAESRLAALPKNNVLTKAYKKYLALATNNLGMSYRENGKVMKAIDYLMQSLKLHEELGMTYEAGQVYNNMATVYFDIGDRDKALETFEKSYALLKDKAEFHSLQHILTNLAYIYYVTKKFPEALKDYYVCLEMAEKEKDKRVIARCLNGIGLVYSEQGAREKGLEYYKKSLLINQEIRDAKGIGESMANIGDCYRMQGKYRQALAYTKKELDICRQRNNVPGMRRAIFWLSDIYEHLGDYKQALALKSEYIRQRDSSYNERVRKVVLKQQLSYEYDKKELLLKEEQSRLKKLYEQKQKFYFILAGILLLLLLFVALLFYFRYKFKKEKESKNLHIELKERLKQEIEEKERIANSVLHIQEHEREKLAAELHDGVNQLLFAAKIQLQASKSVNESMYKQAVNMVDTAIYEIRSIAANEGSFLLKNKLLKDALTDLVLQMKGHQACDISFLNYGFDEEQLKQDQKINILRIIQELLNNAVKHARAKNSYISIKTTSDSVLFAVTDNGRGIDTGKTVGGNGLKNVSNKVTLMKGVQRVFSLADKGTKLFIIIPLH